MSDAISKQQIDQLDAALSEILIGNSKRGDIYFLQTLCDLLRNQPQILDYSLKVEKGLKTSFILITLEKIFSYCLRYSHAIYQPYFPPTPTVLEKVSKVLKLHFPESENDIIKVFLSLTKEKVPEIHKAIKDLYNIGESKITQAVSLTANKNHCSVPNYKDPGVYATGISELWDSKPTKEVEWDPEFLSNFPSWAKGVLNGMVRTFALYQIMQKSKVNTRFLINDVKLQAQHNLVNLLITCEYFWLYNRREVDMDRGLPLSQTRIIMYGQINAISDQFIRLLPENHPFFESNDRRNWAAERVSGTKGAQKLVLRFLNFEEELMVECTDGSIFFRPTNRTLAIDAPSGDDVPTTKVIKSKQYTIKSYQDMGVREAAIAELMAVQKSEYCWQLENFARFDTWAIGILKSMFRTQSLMGRFIESNDLSIKTDRGPIQPVHVAVKILIGCEYYWQFNIREVRLSNETTFEEKNKVHQDQIYTIYEEFLEVYPIEHPFHEGKEKERARRWTIQRIKGTNGAAKVFLQYKGSEGTFMIEATGTSVSIKEVIK
ncbi:MAG: hypothetical protein KC646_01435 [Candidatus Cloacimonetes bacterium]|nr:hypothetical protein [Candidatus Cloacimonadota bacterium]